LWDGILSALGAVAFGMAALFGLMIVLIVTIVAVSGKKPDLNPGHALVGSTEAVLYLASGAFAWWRMRRLGRRPFRGLTQGDFRAILIGIGAIILVWVLTTVQLALTGQTKHTQSGFEHFDVIGRTPLLTALNIGLIVFSSIILAPIVEELIFRALLFGALAPRLGIVAGGLVTALLFGATHGDWILFPALAALGFIAAFAYAATGNLWVAIILHALNNTLGIAVLIAGAFRHHHK
jgi:membrane protease YdiL (CAAX protease family)